MLEGVSLSASESAYLATLFDVGSIAGGVCAGAASDRAGGKRATTCVAFLALAIPTVAILYYEHESPIVS